MAGAPRAQTQPGGVTQLAVAVLAIAAKLGRVAMDSEEVAGVAGAFADEARRLLLLARDLLDTYRNVIDSVAAIALIAEIDAFVGEQPKAAAE